MIKIKKMKRVGHGQTQITREKISETAKRNGVGKWMKGRKRSQAIRDKMSRALSGRTLSEEHKKKISQAHLGLDYGPPSKDHREKIGDSLRRAYAEGRRYPPKWNGGKYIETGGYVYVLHKNHPHRNKKGYVFEHRLVIEKMIGRYLATEESVHHINRKRNDNRPENLMAFKTKAAHVSLDKWGKENPHNVIFDGRLLK